MNKADEFFLQTVNDLCLEAYAGSRYGIKRQAGVAIRGPITSDKVQQAHFQRRYQQNIQDAINEGSLYNVVELIMDSFKGDKEKATKAILKLLKTHDINQSNWINPYPKISEIGPFTIPKFRLPDALEHLKTIIKNPESPSDKKLAELILSKLSQVHDQAFGVGSSEDPSEHAVRSFDVKNVERTFQGGEKKVVKTPAVVGGISRLDKEQGSQIHVTNSREGVGKNERRLKKYKDKLFTFDPRSNPDEHDSSSHVPERRTPENLAGATLANPDREKLASPKPKKKRAASKPASTPAKKKKKSVKKPAKKTVEKESFFIKVIPF